MTAPEFPPVVFVDLINTPEPKLRKLIPGRTRWQPWSAMISSAGNHEDLFKSTESWTNRSDAVNAIRLAFTNGSNVYLRQAELGNVLLRRAVPSGE